MNSNVTVYSTNIRSVTHGGGSFIFSPLFKKCFLYQTAGLKGLSILRSFIRRVASGGAGGHCPPDFCFSPPIYFLPPHGIFLRGKSCCFCPEKPFKFAISARKSLRILARKSLRISAKTFFFPFWRSPVFGRKKPSNFGEDLFFFFFV